MARVTGVPTRLGDARIGRGGGLGSVTSRVRVLGLQDALRKIAKVAPTVRLHLGQITAGAAIHMQNLAQEYVGVQSGNLKSGIKIAKVGSYTWNVTASSRDGDVPDKSSYEYAPFHEFGWHDRSGQFHAGTFFMTRAYRETYPLVVNDLRILARRLERL